MEKLHTISPKNKSNKFIMHSKYSIKMVQDQYQPKYYPNIIVGIRSNIEIIRAKFKIGRATSTYSKNR